VRSLASKMMDGHHLIYVDETTVYKWHRPRTWAKDNLTLAIPQTRGPSISIVSAISSMQGLVHYEVLRGGNNKERFGEFVRGIRVRIRGTATVVMDNLSVHHSAAVKDRFDEAVQ